MLVKSSRTLFISDGHSPYSHRDFFPFLKELKRLHKPDLIINIGDEVDHHAISRHPKDPDVKGAREELDAARDDMRRLYEIFPSMVLVESNHGSRVYRRALEQGLSREYIRSYNEVLKVGAGWRWYRDFTFQNGQPIYVNHGKAKHAINVSKNIGLSTVQGHYHTEFSIRWWSNPVEQKFAMQVGCLIDDTSYAFNYNKNEVERPIIGTGLIIDGRPILEKL